MRHRRRKKSQTIDTRSDRLVGGGGSFFGGENPTRHWVARKASKIGKFAAMMKIHD
jgi:hypothetical protein